MKLQQLYAVKNNKKFKKKSYIYVGMNCTQILNTG